MLSQNHLTNLGKLNLLCLYASSYNVSQHFNHVKGLVYIICRVVI